VVAIAATVVTTLVGDRVTDAAIATSILSDRTLVTSFVGAGLTGEDIRLALTPGRRQQLQVVVDALIDNGIARVKVYRPDGTIQLSDNRSLVGQVFPPGDELVDALGGVPVGILLSERSFDEPDLKSLHIANLVEEYLPITTATGIAGVLEVYRDAAPLLSQVNLTHDMVLLITILGSAVLAIILYFIFRTADARLKRQTRELLESTRRDALTGTLTHGAVVDLFSILLESAIAAKGALSLALIDIDNFRLLNEAHGHRAGDQVLQQVGDILAAELPREAIVGRFGPDEFLVVAQSAMGAGLGPSISRFRSSIGELAVRFGDSERLPVTVSIGLCSFPQNGRSATELLSMASVALSQARMSGGDQVRNADTAGSAEEQTERASFDVLQGLVIAVDTKDRYTKRHSEDVARYALFLADQLNLPPELLRTLHIAGLLHDIGKIGIPDSILRKPAPLSAEEYAIVKQHVALGHMIVRDLPHLEQVRAGIRFHHEQWDGAGYLDGLHGEEIPLVGRILAVADAFSAMTTSRPYRKALSIREALRRIEDAAGSQLDPELAGPFVRGMETSADAPIPGDDRLQLPRIWLPDGPPSPTVLVPASQ
jgi:diguanylate cyclase (GGDEF)-like protein/putative nucleotidyltransferase with HDIG domain